MKTIFRQADWLFHRLAPFYDYLIRPPQADRLWDLLELSPDSFILDLGGGTGRVSHYFAQLGAKVVICDINVSMLRQTKRKGGLMPLRADAARLPFFSETFDAVLVVDALHHFLKPQQAVREALRVLKPRGRFLIEEQDINRFLIKLVRTAERIVGLHSYFLTRREIAALFLPQRHRISIERRNRFTFRVLACKIEPP
jgi:demethylmenaquinone methyltransferase/2-methoxy-6-polyprenyl-1,4-benzoquinol methylase